MSSLTLARLARWGVIMSERPILLNTAMVQAVLAGRKTQTRRPGARPPVGWNPGDTLWVRETWAPGGTPGATGAYRYRADGALLSPGEKWRPSIHMPRAASRMTLHVARVWRERLTDISWQNILAEGVGDDWDRKCIRVFQAPTPELQDALRADFRYLWVSLYGEGPGGGWNPETWVWVCEFSAPRSV